jgi:uncharacterized coiled-coil protein SlyX
MVTGLTGAENTVNLKSNESRLTSLEELVTHLERTAQDLNDVLLAQQKRIEQLDQQMILLRGEVDRALTDTTQPPRLEDEKPPHY